MELTSILIDGIERIGHCRMSEIQITKETNGAYSTAQLLVLSGATQFAEFTPVLNDEIILFSSGSVRQFAGHIAKIEPRLVSSGPIWSIARIAPLFGEPLFGEIDALSTTLIGLLGYRLTCQDYSRALDNVVCESKNYSSISDKQVLVDLFTNFLPSVDTSLAQTVVESLGSISFQDLTLRQCIEKIVERTGATWYIDFNNKLRYHAANYDAATFSLSESPNGSSSFAFQREGFNPVDDFRSPANSIRVLGLGAETENGLLTENPPASADDGQIYRFTSVYPPTSGTELIDTGATVALARRDKSGVNYFLGNALLAFDTNGIVPAGAVITSATLKLYIVGNLFDDSGEVGIEYYAYSNWPITSADWSATPANTAYGYTPLFAFTMPGYNNLALLNPAANINTTGYTGFRVHVRTPAGAPNGTNWFQFYTTDAAADKKPILEIAYTLTTPGIEAQYDDAASQAAYGVISRTIIDRSIQTAEEALLRAQYEAALYAMPQRSVSLDFYRDGLDRGQYVALVAPSVGFSGDYIVQRLRMRWQDNSTVRYAAELGSYRPDLIRLLRQLKLLSI